MNTFKAIEVYMKLDNISIEHIFELIHEISILLNFSYGKIPQILFVLGILGAVIFLNRKIKMLEVVQINDIDDITSFNRLIDDELGILKEEHDKKNKGNNKSKKVHEISQEKPFTNAPYTQAIYLAQRGYARDEIISLCSLTESEADLILALHTDTKAA